MCNNCEHKTWKCWFVACNELGLKFDKIDFELANKTVDNKNQMF